MEINKYISELVYKNDCVIIPGFGAILCRYKAAEFDAQRDSVTPPTKTLVFNDKLMLGDGQLDRILSTRKAISFEQAGEEISTYVKYIWATLNKEKTYSIDGIGHFFKAEEGLVFEPETKINYLETSFILPEVFFKKIERTGNPSKKIADRPSVPNDKVKPVAKKRTKWWLLVPVILTLGIAYSFYAVDFNGLFKQNHQEASSKSQYNFDDPMGKQIDAQELSRKEAVAIEPETTVAAASIVSAPSNDEVIEEVPATQETAPVVQQQLKTKVKVVSEVSLVSEATNRFYLIMGGFGSVENAEKARVKLAKKGYDAKVIEPVGGAGLYRVSLSDFPTKVEADLETAKVKSEFAGVWVLTY